MIKAYSEQISDLPKLDRLLSVINDFLGQTCDFYFELSLVSARRIHQINLETRGVDSVTDVLSFPMLDGVKGKIVKYSDYPFDFDPDRRAIFLGSVVLCMGRVKSQAKTYGHSEERETYYLITHALLHLFGYDHIEESDRAEMRKAEEKIMNEMGIVR
ncbi:MAG: rRNA maturation RNase YbeY [Clostridia bacterium]|nr:rRNA maturation RNase YbeY [Clostridia bacterium]